MLTRRKLLQLLPAAAVAVGCATRRTNSPPRAQLDLAPLAAGIRGTVYSPAAAEYEQARRTFSFNPTTDRHPAAIVRCLDELDVARSIAFARKQGLELAVRGGGHDVLGASTCDGGLVIDLQDLKECKLRDGGASAIVGGGVRSGEVTDALKAARRALALGCSPQVGVAGLSLGGGFGWLLGKHGAACDNLLEARLVTADSSIVRCSARENPELFWALRGGGGNFGVAVQLEFAAHPVAEVTAGFICFAGEQLGEFLRFHREFMSRASSDLVVEILVMAPLKPVIFAMVCHLGDPEQAARDLKELRRFAKPLADEIQVRPYADAFNPGESVGALFQRPDTAPKEPEDGPGVLWLGGSIPALSDAAIDVILDRLRGAEWGWAFNLGHHLHGRICDRSFDDSALRRPPGAFTYHFDTWWQSRARAERQMAWVNRSVAAMQPHSIPSYVNYLGTNAPEAVSASYGPSYSRLQSLKRRYDPDNVFHANRNIRA